MCSGRVDTEKYGNAVQMGMNDMGIGRKWKKNSWQRGGNKEDLRYCHSFEATLGRIQSDRHWSIWDSGRPGPADRTSMLAWLSWPRVQDFSASPVQTTFVAGITPRVAMPTFCTPPPSVSEPANHTHTTGHAHCIPKNVPRFYHVATVHPKKLTCSLSIILVDLISCRNHTANYHNVVLTQETLTSTHAVAMTLWDSWGEVL